MSKIIMTLGIPASGKTKWTTEYCKDNPNTVRVNKDSLRLMIYGEPYKPEWEDFVCTIRDHIISQAIAEGHDVVIDDTNIGKKHRERIEGIAAYYGIALEIKDFTDVPLEVCLERNRNRSNPVPEEAIYRMYNQLKEQT